MALSQWKEAILEGIFMEIKDGVVEEKNLERLENLVEIIHKEGLRVPESVKEAYCKVAVECTAKFLGYEKEAFIEAVRRIWLRRIMPLCDKVSVLVTSELLDSCKRVWKAHNDEMSLMEEDTRENALVALRKVVLELHPDIDDGNEEMDESEEVESSEESGETEPMILGNEIQVYRNPEVSKDVDEEDQESRSDTEAERPSGAECRTRKIKTVSTPEFNRVLGNLRTSKLELVKALEAGGPSNLNNGMITEQEDDVANPSATNTTPKPSLMERKSTAETYEWEDSIDDSDGEMGDDGERNKKSRRKRTAISPLQRSQSCKGARRAKVPWSTAETLAVMKGYEKYGTNWKLIKEEYPVLFRRTNTDIKDKFRVEIRRKEREGTGVVEYGADRFCVD